MLARREREGRPLAIGQGQHDALAVLERAQHAVVFPARQGHVGLQVHVAQGQAPAVAEASGSGAVERIVGPAERQLVAGQVQGEVGFGT